MDQLNTPKISLFSEHISKMVEIAERRMPNEACGVIAGKDRTSKKIYEVNNTLNSPVEYYMDPEELIKVFSEIETNAWDTLAFFHSHPISPPIPSKTDLEKSFYPDTPYVIIGRERNEWKIRAFLLDQTSFIEIPHEEIKKK